MIVDEWNAYFQEQSSRRARGIAEEIQRSALLSPGVREPLNERLRRWQEQDELQLIWVVAGGRVVARAGALFADADPEMEEQAEQLVRDMVERAGERGEPVQGIDHLGEGLLAHSTVQLGPDAGRPVEDGFVVVGIVLPSRLAENLADIDLAAGAYRRFRAQRSDMVRFYLTMIGLVFLLTLFVATWIGLYLSRRITVPIHELASAAREISAGNLDVRVNDEIGDELGMLVEAFNEMAAELQENRAVITRSTADLRRSNRALDERRRYIETLLANLSTAVLSLDPVGRVTTANPAVKRILGVDAKIGQTGRTVFASPGLEPLADLLAQSDAQEGGELRRDIALPENPGALNVAAQISPLRGAIG